MISDYTGDDKHAHIFENFVILSCPRSSKLLRQCSFFALGCYGHFLWFKLHCCTPYL